MVLFQEFIFWALAVGSVGAALGVVLLRDIFRAALLLVVVFLALAGLFVLLRAEFLAVVQVLIYAGAISILIVFAIMLTRDVQRGNLPNRLQIPAVLLPALLLSALIFVFVDTDWRLTEALPGGENIVIQAFENTPFTLGRLLIGCRPPGCDPNVDIAFVLPFGIAAVLLLASVIGALSLVREK